MAEQRAKLSCLTRVTMPLKGFSKLLYSHWHWTLLLTALINPADIKGD